MPEIQIYCDGACSNNQSRQNVGGWGAVLIYGGHQKQICGGERDTSNQRMELRACMEALKLIKRTDVDITIFSDSAYLVNCFRQKWYRKWESNGWMTAKKHPVENQDLWTELISLFRKFPRLTFQKVSGHSGVKFNELADRLANKGLREVS